DAAGSDGELERRAARCEVGQLRCDRLPVDDQAEPGRPVVVDVRPAFAVRLGGVLLPPRHDGQGSRARPTHACRAVRPGTSFTTARLPATSTDTTTSLSAGTSTSASGGPVTQMSFATPSTTSRISPSERPVSVTTSHPSSSCGQNDPSGSSGAASSG